MAGRAVLAAGGVVWRRSAGSATFLEVAVVHRPRYDDWSLPKGKLGEGETALEAAVREVHEEIGADVVVSRRIGSVKYQSAGAAKKVTYWMMRTRGGDFSANDEIDELQWLPVPTARRRLSYDVDRAVLADFASLPMPDSVVVLVRHAKAGKRSEWPGEDALRPLDATGRRQASRLAGLLGAFGPSRVYSAEPVRCVETVRPLAAALDVEVRIDSAFDDESYASAPSMTQTALLALAKPGKVSVVCSQGLTVPSLIDRLGPGIQSSDTRKGAWWVLSLVDGDVVSADHYNAP